MKKETILHIILAFLFFSCESELPFNATDTDAQWVVNGQISAQGKIEFQISRSAPLLSEPILRGPSGQIVVGLEFNNGFTPKIALPLDSGKFSLEFPYLFTGDYLKATFSSDLFETISIVDNVPQAEPELIFDTVTSIEDKFTLNFNLQDKQQNEFYIISFLQMGYTALNGDTVYSSKPITISVSDKIFLSNINTQRNASNYALFSDRIFNGRKQRIRVNIEQNDLQDIQTSWKATDIQVNIKSISEKYYLFLKSIIESNHVFSGPLSGFANSKGNADQALGFIFVYQEKTLSIPLPKR